MRKPQGDTLDVLDLAVVALGASVGDPQSQVGPDRRPPGLDRGGEPLELLASAGRSAAAEDPPEHWSRRTSAARTAAGGTPSFWSCFGRREQ